MAGARSNLVQQLIGSVRNGDTAAFPKDGIVNDWGTEYRGHYAIRIWSDREFIGAQGVLTVRNVRRSGNEVIVDAGWTSNFFSGDSRFVFVVDGDRIAEMRITGAQ